MSFGPLQLRQVGVMGTGPVLGWPGVALLGEVVWDSWQENAPGGHAVAWIGANVLKNYQLTIDYAGRTSYWQRNTDIESDDLTQVGVTLVYRSDKYLVGRVVRKDGELAVAGLASHDEILGVDGQKTYGWSRDSMFAALRGRPGDHHTLTIGRDGRASEVSVPVTSF